MPRACRSAGGGDDHLPEHARRVRDGDQTAVRDRPSPRRPRVHRRRQHERAGRRGGPGRVRRRREPFESPQDVLHSARRWRPWRGAGVRRGGSGFIPSGTRRWRPAAESGGRRLRRPARQRGRAADQLDVLPDDGGRGPEAGHGVGDPRRQLREREAPRSLSHALFRSGRPRGPRVHPRPAAAEGHERRDGRRRGQAAR